MFVSCILYMPNCWECGSCFGSFERGRLREIGNILGGVVSTGLFGESLKLIHIYIYFLTHA